MSRNPPFKVKLEERSLVNTFINFKNNSFGTSPAVQWLRQRASTAGAWLPTLVGELRSYMSQVEVKRKY